MEKKKGNRAGKGRTPQNLSGKHQTDSRKLLGATLFIGALTFFVYLPVFSNGFVSLDDNNYIQNQLLLRNRDLEAYFSQFVMGNYHPFVMLVYAIIYNFFTLSPAAYHTVSLLLHVVNTGLVLWLLFYLTESFPVSFIVALLFGIHPLHVESVAWASELKDVMYSMGFLFSLLYYVRYVKENNLQKLYVYSLLFFVFAVLSKAMAVSLTPILFLIDFYLGRKFTFKTMMEKIPFIIISIIIGIVAIYAQISFEAIQDVTKYSLPQRMVFACYGFVTYLIRFLIPVNLCAYYSYPSKTGGALPALYYLYPVLCLLIAVVTIYSLRKTKKIFFGITFYAFAVFLELQLLPVGNAITADRYTYISSIGIFFLMAEGLMLLPGTKVKGHPFSSLSVGIAIIIVLFFMYQANNQVRIWKDSMILWNNVISISPNSPIAYMNRGVEYRDVGKFNEAEADFQQALKQANNFKDAWSNLGGLYFEWGKRDNAHKDEYFKRAVEYTNKSIEIDSAFSSAYANRAAIFYTLGKTDEALQDFNKAIKLDSTFDMAWFNRGVLYYKQGKMDQACYDFKKAASLGNAQAANDYAKVCR